MQCCSSGRQLPLCAMLAGPCAPTYQLPCLPLALPLAAGQPCTHLQVLALDGEGGWTLHKGARSGGDSSSSDFEDVCGGPASSMARTDLQPLVLQTLRIAQLVPARPSLS